MIDPRIFGIKRRLEAVKKIYAVASSKGGVGKTLISVLLALKTSEMGYKTGLLDLDFTNPTCHLLLRVQPKKLPEEDKGVIPPTFLDLKFMTIIYYTGDEALALRGGDIDNAIKEILTITRWLDTEILFIDMPPGLSDEFLDIAGLLEKVDVLVVTTPSILSIKSVERMLKLFRNQVNIDGLIENMVVNDVRRGSMLSKKFNIDYLGYIPFISDLDKSLVEDDIENIMKRKFDTYIKEITRKLLD